MDCQSVVADRAAAVIETSRIECDQAVFTSIPSPMGRGYRIVAASGGVTANERREIIQRSPSHGALASAAADAAAVVSFGIAGGRHCVMASWHAEAEHTGRGGFRVHTQIALLDDKQFAAVACDPFAIEPALRAARGAALVADTRLPMLTFSPSIDRQICDAASIEHMATITAPVLSGERVLVTRPLTDASVAVLFDMLPLAARRGVTLCTGLRFAAARALGIVFAPVKKGEVEQILHDHPYVTDESFLTNVAKRGVWSDWLQFASRLIAAGDRRRLRRWTDRMDTPRTAESLGMLARLAQSLDAIESMIEADLSTLLARPYPVTNDALVLEVQRSLTEAAQQRLTRLRAEAAQNAESIGDAIDLSWP